MNADLSTALLTAKFCSRDTLGVRKVLTSQDEVLGLLFRHMILEVLGDSSCLAELTADEAAELGDVLLINL